MISNYDTARDLLSGAPVSTDTHAIVTALLAVADELRASSPAAQASTFDWIGWIDRERQAAENRVGVPYAAADDAALNALLRDERYNRCLAVWGRHEKLAAEQDGLLAEARGWLPEVDTTCDSCDRESTGGAVGGGRPPERWCDDHRPDESESWDEPDDIDASPAARPHPDCDCTDPHPPHSLAYVNVLPYFCGGIRTEAQEDKPEACGEPHPAAAATHPLACFRDRGHDGQHATDPIGSQGQRVPSMRWPVPVVAVPAEAQA